jgi:hypothetical protein
MGKSKGKHAAGSDAPAKKGRTSRWAPSTFSANDLKKLRATGLLAAATEVMMPAEEALPRPASGFRVMFM